jgi:hypothetical protein
VWIFKLTQYWISNCTTTAGAISCHGDRYVCLAHFDAFWRRSSALDDLAVTRTSGADSYQNNKRLREAHDKKGPGGRRFKSSLPTNKSPNSRFLHMEAVFGCLRSRRVRIWRQILSQAHARILTPLFSAC